MTTGREALLAGMGEDEFARQVVRWAHRAEWCGIHVRYSQGVVQGVHTTRLDGHSDAHGMPDWIFAKPGMPLLMPELKTLVGRLGKDQPRWLDLLNQTTGVRAPVWRPNMEVEIKAELGL
jgi:hypothetical protein